MQSADSVGPLRCYGLGLVDPEASPAILIGGDSSQLPTSPFAL